MTLPTNIFNKYLNRFDELISEGESIEKLSLQEGGIDINNYFQSFITWKTKCISLFDQVIPGNSVHQNLIKELNTPDSAYKVDSVYRDILVRCISYLKAIKSDLQNGLLRDLALEIEAEIAADYMGQSEQLLGECQSGKYDHIPAAVLAGAVLEKTLRTLCSKQEPPILTVNSRGSKMTLNPLIDELKKAGLFNELKAKQLRAWADIRNAAAHGEFDNFNRHDVKGMIQSINNFLSTYIV